MIEVFLHDEKAEPEEQTARSIIYDNGKYFMTYFKERTQKLYNKAGDTKEFRKEAIFQFGWKKELKILERKIKLEKLLS